MRCSYVRNFGNSLFGKHKCKKCCRQRAEPGSFRLLTWVLWFGGEIIGFFIGMAVTDGEILIAYGIALMFAIFGGVAAYIMAKTCAQGDHQELHHAQLPGAQPLNMPCTLTIARDNSFVSALISYSVSLNGQHRGTLKNGENMQVSATLVQNVIAAKDVYGTEIKPLFFAVPSGGSAQIVFKPQRFMPEKCAGISVLTETNILNLAQNSQEYPLPANALPTTYAQPTFAVQYSIPQAETVPVLPENPMRAVWMMGGALLFMLVGAFTFFPALASSFDSTNELVTLAYSLLLGIAVYLILQNDVKNKIIIGVGLLVGAFVQAISVSYMGLFARTMKAKSIGYMLTNPQFTNNLKSMLISAALVGVVCVLISLAVQANAKKKFAMAAWISTAIVILYKLLTMRFYLAVPDIPIFIKFAALLAMLTRMLCIPLFAYLVYLISSLKRKELVTGTGAKIWFSFCIVFTSISVVLGFFTKTMGILSALIALLGIVGYVFLLRSKTIGFPLVLLSVLMTVVSGFVVGLTGYEPSFLNAIVPLIGLVNPLITWAIILPAWHSKSGYTTAVTTMPAEKLRLPLVFLVFEIVGGIFGLVLFGAGIYSVFSYIFHPAPLLFGVILGGALTALEAVASVQYIKKRGRADKPLQIIGLCGGTLIILIFSIGFLTSL